MNLKGAPNFRDMGGLRNAQGRVLRAGRVFRSDHLGALTADDIAALQRHGKKKGVASLCIGGGEATAVAVELI